MKIRKRNGQEEAYRRQKIERVIRLAFESVQQSCRVLGIGHWLLAPEMTITLQRSCRPIAKS